VRFPNYRGGVERGGVCPCCGFQLNQESTLEQVEAIMADIDRMITDDRDKLREERDAARAEAARLQALLARA
jgi:hypothetical protein